MDGVEVDAGWQNPCRGARIARVVVGFSVAALFLSLTAGASGAAGDAPPAPPPSASLPANGLQGGGARAALQDGSLARAAGPDGSVRMFAVRSVGDHLEVNHYKADSAGQAVAIADGLSKQRGLVSLDVDEKVHATGTLDPRRAEQWALDRTSFEQAWSSTNGAGVIVAVLDTGVRADHEDLAGSVLPGADMITGGNDARTDPLGHGTHVAGIIAAHPNNYLGIAGAAPGARILPVRVLSADGSGYMSDVAKGIIWAADHGARIESMSLGGPTPAAGVQSAIRYANSKRVAVFVAAGNNAMTGDAPTYPAAYPEAIAVGSVDPTLTRSAFSNFQPYLDLVAPGSGILSTYATSPNAYAIASGTSMATPYAAAAGALVVARNPGISAVGVAQALEAGAIDLGPPGHDSQYGDGLINPEGALLRTGGIRSGGTKGTGYWVVTVDGRVRGFGSAAFYGDLGQTALPAPVVASARTKSGHGYWLVTATGAVYSFGDAQYYGGMGGQPLNAFIVGMTPTASGHGYYLVGSDGGVFSFGDARFYGSTGGMHLNAPVLDMAVARNGRGYWFVAADGGVFTFGNAAFKGSTGSIRLNQPVRSMTTTARGSGYWLVALDGGIFTFGEPYHGSLPSIGVPTSGGQRIRSLPDGSGYYVLTSDGGVFNFGSARSFGSAAPLSVMVPATDLMVAG